MKIYVSTCRFLCWFVCILIISWRLLNFFQYGCWVKRKWSVWILSLCYFNICLQERFLERTWYFTILNHILEDYVENLSFIISFIIWIHFEYIICNVFIVYWNFQNIENISSFIKEVYGNIHCFERKLKTYLVCYGFFSIKLNIGFFCLLMAKFGLFQKMLVNFLNIE